jgi:SAM-dependent methyltransferase
MRLGVLDRLASNRRAVDTTLSTSARRRLASPALYCLYAALTPRVALHVSGPVLDAGCGTMPFRQLIADAGAQYFSMDVEQRVNDVDFVGDLQDMSAIPTESFDTVLCSEVLEHLPTPSRALSEIARILKPGGKVLLTVPYLCRLHEEPRDYFRYTSHGLRHLLETAGFVVLEIAPTGSVFSFVGHQVSSFSICSAWHVPVLRQLVFWANAVCCTFPCYWLDQISGMARKLPLGYVAVAQKPAALC